MFNGQKPHHPSSRFFLYFADFSYILQSDADLGGPAHGPIKKWDRFSGFRATPRATASWAYEYMYQF